jgi:hypothetical protein
MAAVMIGVDPHEASHTAAAISAAEEPLGELRVRACGSGRAAAGLGRGLATADLGRSRAPAARATCWPSSCCPPVSGYWMSRPSSAPGSGCWPRGT